MVESIFGFVIGLTFITGFFLGTYFMTVEARDRGYMEQCVGKIGWHWECPSD
jgi:hypothetical protein